MSQSAPKGNSLDILYGWLTVGLLFVIPLLIGIAVCAARYARGIDASIVDVKAICLLYAREGRHNVLTRHFVDCADAPNAQKRLPGRYVGTAAAVSISLTAEVEGKTIERVVNMTPNEFREADRGGVMKIASGSYEGGPVSVMNGWSYALTPISVTLAYLMENPGLGFVAIAILVLQLLINGLPWLLNAIRRWHARGRV